MSHRSSDFDSFIFRDDKTGLVDWVKTNGTAVFNHDYDTAGRLTKVTRPDGKVVEYGYDAAGNRASLKYPGTPTYTVNYSYDELGRPKEVKENGTTTLASWSYPDRLNATVTYANTTGRAVQRTLSGELATLTNTLNGEAPQFSLYYNKTGQVTNQRITVPAYAYQPPGTGSNAYVPNPMNQYGSVGAVTQTFDNNGNLTNDGTWTFGYDAESRLTSASKTGVTASYLYDPFGRREQKTVNSTVTQYLLDGPSVIEEYDGSNTRTARYVYAPNIDEPLYMERNGNRYFYHFDGSGSVVALTGTNGIVSERYTYSPYGESTATSAVGNPYRYTGRELDAETGLYYYRARYYSTSLGRFLQPDPIGYQGGLNLYAYVGNDPLNLTDPTGLLAREISNGAFSVYNNLTSGLISQPSLFPPPLPARSGMSVVDAFRSNTHDYTVNTLLCSRCAPQAQSELYYAQYPFQDGVKVTPPVARDILSTSSLAITVTETRNPNGTITLTNITQPSHLLFDGRVARSITTLGDDSYVTTRGTGRNSNGFIAAANQLLGPLLFQSVDETLKGRVNGR